MKVFLDTSVLVAAVVGDHAQHAKAFILLERVQQEKDEGLVSAHSLAEMYAVLTKLPPPFRHTPEQALLSIEENVLKHFNVVALTASEFTAVIRESTLGGLSGGIIYDALLLKSAIKARADMIFTFNLKHFQTVATGETAQLIASP